MSSGHYDLISDREWAWITKCNRERAELALAEAKRKEDEARKAVGLTLLWAAKGEKP